ncbi:MAG: hypothetical protein JWM32_241 [Verrucomicrobia bacterium]|nr:hypothetical protein [Verrucomicrobiota bacterium]
MTASEKPIIQVFDAYKAAVFAKDVEAFIALYDQDVCVFDLWGKWSYEGINAWRGMVAGWFGSLGTERVVVTFQDVQTFMGDIITVAHASITYQSISAEGQALRAMQNRLTWALGRKNGTWKIVHEHTSAPVDLETTKAILKR